MQLTRSFGAEPPYRRTFTASLVARIDARRRVFAVIENETGRRAWALVRHHTFVCVFEAHAFAGNGTDMARVRVTARWAARKAMRNGF